MPYMWEHGYTEIKHVGFRRLVTAIFFTLLSSSKCLYMGCYWKSCDFLKFSFPCL